MQGVFVNLTGMKIGKLTVIEYLGKSQWVCECECDNIKLIRADALRNGDTKSCGCLIGELGRAKRGILNPLWKGGRKIWEGYAYIRIDNEPGKHAKYIPEHRQIMEHHLGRKLLPGETIHHKNGVRDDNRLENLELMIRHPPGQRVEDAVDYAVQILRKYRPELLANV